MTATPDFNTFKELAKQGNLVPVYREVVADLETPVSAYYKICGENIESNPDANNGEQYHFLLESVEGGENIARYSFLGSNPRAIFIQEKGRAELINKSGRHDISGKDVFEKIHKALSDFQPVEVEGLPPFTGGAVGYVSYDVVSEVETSVKQPETIPLDTPEALFMITDTLLAFDRVRHTIKVISQVHLDDDTDLEAAYKDATAKIDALVERLEKPLAQAPVTMDTEVEDLNFNSNKSREEFHAMVNKAKEYIYDGDIIQAVLSQRFSIDLPAPPIAVYRALRMINPSPYMFLLNCGDFSLVGASPEVSAKCQDRNVTVRPIAGTRWRGKNQAEDLALEKELLADPKERAEHIMLVDLARNDIGRIAKTGTVEVKDLMVVERYSHVMHIVSNVEGELDEAHEADSVMRSTFPAGTLSGAPKVRAMQIISELEKERRGPYGGAVAYYSFTGNFDSCITIRTAVLKNGKAYIQAGGGIVADSDPDAEFNESCNKAKAMMRALATAKVFY